MKHLRIRLAFCVVLAVFSLGCGAVAGLLPTSTPYPTYTPYPNPTAYPTFTPYPEPTAYPTYTPYPTATLLPLPTPYPTYTPWPTPTAGAQAGDLLIGTEDATAFFADLTSALQALEWEIREREGYIVAQGTAGLFIWIRYVYDTPETQRLLLVVPYRGEGEQNLSLESLTQINEINFNNNLVKISVESDGDVWLESTYPVVNGLDVDALSTYMEWYGATVKAWVSSTIGDFVQ